MTSSQRRVDGIDGLRLLAARSGELDAMVAVCAHANARLVHLLVAAGVEEPAPLVERAVTGSLFDVDPSSPPSVDDFDRHLVTRMAELLDEALGGSSGPGDDAVVTAEAPPVEPFAFSFDDDPAPVAWARMSLAGLGSGSTVGPVRRLLAGSAAVVGGLVVATVAYLLLGGLPRTAEVDTGPASEAVALAGDVLGSADVARPSGTGSASRATVSVSVGGEGQGRNDGSGSPVVGQVTPSGATPEPPVAQTGSSPAPPPTRPPSAPPSSEPSPAPASLPPSSVTSVPPLPVSTTATLPPRSEPEVRPDVGATVQHRSFRGADLTGLDFSGVTLRHVTFDGVDLRGVSFAGAALLEVVFASSDLTGADFRDADLHRVSFDGSDISGVDFTGSVAKRAPIDGYWAADAPPIGRPATRN